MDSFNIFESIIKSEGQNIFYWNKLLNLLRESKEK